MTSQTTKGLPATRQLLCLILTALIILGVTAWHPGDPTRHANTPTATTPTVSAQVQAAARVRVAAAGHVPVSATQIRDVHLVRVPATAFHRRYPTGFAAPRDDVRVAVMTIAIAHRAPVRATAVVRGTYPPLGTHALWDVSTTGDTATAPTVMRVGYGKGPSLGTLILAPAAAAVDVNTRHYALTHGMALVPDDTSTFDDHVHVSAYDTHGACIADAVLTRVVTEPGPSRAAPTAG